MKWNVTARAMRTIKKYGGLDKYILGVRTKWLGERAMWLRSRLQDETRKRASIGDVSSGESNNIVQAVRPKTELERRSERILLTMPVCSSQLAFKRKNLTFSIETYQEQHIYAT